MSVLNQSGEEQVECPLCMEPLEVDDLNFYPCTCGYQICRFCWHRIRTDENGLCPACRKAYSENPADFTPLSKEQVAQLKAEKRQRDQQRKAKLSESRKHLASVRVVQRNLVFVVGLPMRLADPEVLKKHEYFGKFGKIHKVVINQSTAYAGTQGPSASAYVTYMKSDDALRAIQSVNNSTLDGKTIKTSLGTTKYCSHFMKNQSCPKPDCMYLHDFGDQEASFTKEQMHAGKHQEYEKKLHDCLLAKLAAQQQAAAAAQIAAVAVAAAAAVSSSESSSSSSSTSKSGGGKHSAKHTVGGDHIKDKDKDSACTNGKECGGSWPQLDKDKDGKAEANNKKASEANGKENGKPEKSKRNKKNVNVSENNSKNNKNRNSAVANGVVLSAGDDSCANKEKDKERVKDKERDAVKDKECEHDMDREEKTNRQTAQTPLSPPTTPPQGKDSREKILETSSEERKRPNSVVLECTNNNTIKTESDFIEKQQSPQQQQPTQPAPVPADYKMQLHNDNSSFFTSNSFSCAKQQLSEAGDHHHRADDDEGIAEPDDDEDDANSLLSRQINGQEHPLLDGDAWDFDFGYPNHSHHLEELATRQTRQRVEPAKDSLAESFANAFGGCGLDRFAKFDALMDSPYIPSNTESLLETLAKNSVNYQMHPTISTTQHQQQQQQQQQQNLRQQHYMNGHKDALLSGLGLLDQQQHPGQAANGYPKILDMYRSMYAPLQHQTQQQPPQGLINGLHSQSNGFHNFAQQQQQQQQMNHFNHMSMLDKRMALQQQLQQQRQLEENFLSLSLGKQMQHQQQQHGYAQMNGGSHQFDGFATSMANSFGLGTGGHSVVGGNSNVTKQPNRHVVDDNKDLDYRFQEAQKALEALVESDNHVHNSGRTTLGTNQLNGLVHSQSGTHMPPPPPGFVQPNTHMNSFGSKILPFLNMNGQQQQQQPQINTTQQNNWPSNFSQIQQQQQPSQHNKGMGGVCNDWKVLDTAIISASSRRHIPSMGALLDQPYTQSGAPQPGGGSININAALQQQQAAAAAAAAAQQQRTYDMYATFSNYSNPLPAAAVYASAAGYQTHLPSASVTATQPNLNWLGGELGGPTTISTPPGFRTAGQATKQQEC